MIAFNQSYQGPPLANCNTIKDLPKQGKTEAAFSGRSTMTSKAHVFCTKCGIKNKMESIYCFKCGKTLQHSVDDDEEKETDVMNVVNASHKHSYDNLIIQVNRILHFNGDKDVMTINLPNKFPKFLDGERTISAWYKTSTNDVIIVNIGTCITSNPANEQFAVAARKDGIRLYGKFKENDFTFSNETDQSINYLDNKWRHIVVIKKGSNAQLFINGAYIGKTKDHKYETGKSGAQYVVIGGWYDTNRYFNGYIGDVRVYDTALNKVEIHALYKEGLKRELYSYDQ